MTRAIDRRRALAFLGAAALGAAASGALGQDYPARSLRLLVGFPAGAQTDSIARLVAAKLGDALGQSIVVENRSGASGVIAAEAAARAPADGYTLLAGGQSNLVLAPLIFDNLQYDPDRDFVPIGRVARVPFVIAVARHVPAASFEELLSLARAKPGTLTYASGAIGTVVTVESMMDLAGATAINVPYKGTAPAVTDVIAGRVDFILADYAALAPHARTGAIRLLATTGVARGREAANLPTVAELGMPGFAASSWTSVMAPAGVPAEIVAMLRKGLRQVVQQLEFTEAIERMGFDAVDEDAETLAMQIKSERERYRPIIRRLGIGGGAPGTAEPKGPPGP